jgi:hypothetical protein
VFKNINWVAVPGHELVFPGGLAAGEQLTRTQFDAIEQKAIAKGIYNAVAFHRFAGAASDTDLGDFLERAGIGTDLALQFARSVFCARLPVTAEMLDPIIAFLNDKNREYAEGEADYNWSAWADNCSHTMRNALAAANIWSPLSVRTTKIRQIFNLAVPANEFVNLAELMTGGARRPARYSCLGVLPANPARRNASAIASPLAGPELLRPARVSAGRRRFSDPVGLDSVRAAVGLVRGDSSSRIVNEIRRRFGSTSKTLTRTTSPGFAILRGSLT